jgi:selenocysteine lyase/cysteine desulfurase
VKAQAAAGLDVEGLRKQFPALSQTLRGKRLVYLDNACTALKSEGVEAKMRQFYRFLGACGGKRSTHLLSQEVEAEVKEARQAAAEFLGAESANEIVFTSGTTEAANLVARAFPYEKDRREVILTDLEHNAVFLPFYEAAQRGEITLKFCRSKDSRIDPATMRSLITEKTALVAITHASNVSGGVQPVAEICRLAHQKGARVFVDDAQFVSSHREDVHSTQADFCAFSSHKIGGPFGLGVLFGKEQELNRLRHYKVGGGVVKAVTWKGASPEVTYLDAPLRFEAGVANFGAFGGLTAAMRWLRGLPAAGLRAHIAGLVRRAVDGIAAIPQVKIVGRPEDLAQGSLVSLYPTHADFSVLDFNLFLNHELDGRFVAVRAGEHCAHLLHQSLGIPSTIRLSFFAYNTAEEVDVFLDGLKAYVKEACA